MSTSNLIQQLKLDAMKAKRPSEPSVNDVAKSTTFAGVQTALSIFKEVAGNAGVPGLQEGIKGLVIVLDAVQVWVRFVCVNVFAMLIHGHRKHPKMRTTSRDYANA